MMNLHRLKTALTDSATLLALLLAGCASTSSAPVIERAPPQLIEKSAALEVKPGFYMVKKGDTLYSIALDHGQDHKEIATWNNLTDPNVIKVGQILRVAPPEGETAVVTSAVAPPTQVENLSAGAASVENIKHEPRGGIQPYSDAAWAQAQNPAAAAPAVTPAAPSTPVAPSVASVKPAVEAPKPVVAADIVWAWPSANKVSAPFDESSNKGIDFNGKSGEPVLAAAAGKVTLVTNSLRGYGNLIVVKHNTTYLSVYAHNSKMLVTEGQTVTMGQKIAEIGSSDSDHPELHFEIRREGKPVDPAKYLPQR